MLIQPASSLFHQLSKYSLENHMNLACLLQHVYEYFLINRGMSSNTVYDKHGNVGGPLSTVFQFDKEAESASI